MEYKYILAIDAASKKGGIAVGTLKKPDSLFVAPFPQSRTSGEIITLIDSLLLKAKKTLEDIDEIVVIRGPGSFTGIRVGLATAMGLHYSTGKKVGTLTTLEAIAATFPNPTKNITALLDALRNEWYTQTFSCTLEDITPPKIKKLDSIEEDTHLVSETPIETLEKQLYVYNKILISYLFTNTHLYKKVKWGQEWLTKPLYLRPPPINK